jgi:Chaperone of endosialidase
LQRAGSAGGTSLCHNASNEIATCSSSLRYKTAVAPFLDGLSIIRRLRPITFTWKQDGQRDLGLGAEEVADVAPLLTFRNQQGQIEGVKYNQLSAVLINAIKEQQREIEQLREQLRQLQIVRHRRRTGR